MTKESTQGRRLQFRKGLRDGIPIALGYFAVSFTLGIQAKQSGLSALAATIMSLTNNTSAGEFAALGIISAGAPYLELAISQLVINMRYLLMSCALSQKLEPKTSIFHRLLIAFDVTDEVFGISISVPNRLNPFYTYGAMCISIPGWAGGTCMGVIFGNILPKSIVSALSLALYGMFIAIIVPPAREDKHVAVAVIIAMIASFLFTKIPIISTISSGTRIIILTVLIALAMAILFPIKEEKADE